MADNRQQGSRFHHRHRGLQTWHCGFMQFVSISKVFLALAKGWWKNQQHIGRRKNVRRGKNLHGSCNKLKMEGRECSRAAGRYSWCTSVTSGPCLKTVLLHNKMGAVKVLTCRGSDTFHFEHSKLEMRHWHHASVLPMTKGWDEIKAAVDAVVLDVLAVQAALISEVLLKLLVDVVSDWLPAKKETHKDVQRLRPWHAASHPKDKACFADMMCTIQCCSPHRQILECPRW